MNKNIFLISSLSLLFLFAGCEQDIQDVDMTTGGNEPVPLNIVIGGTEDYGDIVSPETRSSETMVESFVQPLDSFHEAGIDIVTTIEMLPEEKTIQTRANMKDGAPFDVVIYDNAGNKVAYCKYKVTGTTASLRTGTVPMLVPGMYKFVCYTYNQNYEPVELPVSVWPGDDFSTYCVAKNITATDNTLNIVFKHQMSRIQLALSSNMDKSATFTYVTTESFYKGNWPVSYTSTDDTKIEGIELMPTYRMNSGSTNCIIPISKKVSFTFNDVTVNGKNYGTKSVDVPVNFVRGGNYKITVHFDKAYPYTEIGGVKWAVSNLSFVDGQVTVKDNPSENFNLLFCGGSLLGYDIAGGVNAGPVAKPSEYNASPTISNCPKTTNLVQNPSNGTGDPCSYYLGQSWRLPTRMEVYNLGGGIKLNGVITNAVWRNKGIYGLKYVSGVFVGANAASAQISGNKVTSNCIFIPASGYYLPGSGWFYDVDRRGSFWTSQVVGSDLDYVGAGFFDVTRTYSGYCIANSIEYGFGVRCIHK